MANTKTKKITKNEATATLTNVNPLISAIRNDENFTTTTNGALTHQTSLLATVDFFAAGGAVRKQSDAQVIELFKKAFNENALIAMKILFYFRDIREGQGERKTFRTIIRWLAINHPSTLLKNLENIPVFGRWDDLYTLVGTPTENQAFDLIKKQFESDVTNAINGKEISLLAKWLKSINTSSVESRTLGRKTAKYLGLSEKAYRKALSNLRNRLDVLERKMTSNRWNEIDFERVPSRASKIYGGAFIKHETDRYKAYLGAVEKGEAKINAGTLYPMDIVKPIEQKMLPSDQYKTYDLLWKNQPDWLKDNPHKGIVVVDTSGSMMGDPICVSVSLGIYFAERNIGPFKNAFITFSHTPKLQIISGNTIVEKVRGLNRNGWSSNTNIVAVFDLVLDTAVKSNIKQTDMPTHIYIVSDMQFDTASGHNANKTIFQTIQSKYERAGYKMPKLVFWNVNASPGQSPVTVNDSGVCLVSGYSPSILKSVLSAKTVTPVDVMLETLNKPRYNPVIV